MRTPTPKRFAARLSHEWGWTAIEAEATAFREKGETPMRWSFDEIESADRDRLWFLSGFILGAEGDEGEA